MVSSVSYQPDPADLCLKCQGLPQGSLRLRSLMPVLPGRVRGRWEPRRGSNGPVMRPAGQAIPHTALTHHTCEKPRIWGLAIPNNTPRHNTSQYLTIIQRKVQNLGPRGLALRLKADQEELSDALQYLRFCQQRSCRDGESKLFIEIVTIAKKIDN